SLQHRKPTVRILKEHLNNAQHRMKVQADKKRNEREFAVGGLVFVKLRPNKQTSLKLHNIHKLTLRLFGLLKVLQRVGAIADKLELPKGTRIHPVFHVSLLKKKTDSLSCALYLPTTLIMGMSFGTESCV
ncbi:UNVERIFIED_CONTAM: hypothetical protein Sindi_2257900, partial [Sesamum indicum]